MAMAVKSPLVSPVKTTEVRCNRNRSDKFFNRTSVRVLRCRALLNAAGDGDRSMSPRAFASRVPRLLHDSKEIDFVFPDAKSKGSREGSSNGLPNRDSYEKIVVAVDVDEVLGNFVSAINQFMADRYSLHHSVSEYHVYEFAKIWNCSTDEANIRVHEFFESPYFRTAIHPIPGARNALQSLSKVCNLSIVTSRQHVIQEQTLEWIDKHYPGLFQKIHFGNHFALNGKSIPKSEICRSLEAKVLIDDNPIYAIECAEAGIKVLLFDYENSYPWSKTELVNGHPLITRVHNWEEVEFQFATSICPNNSNHVIPK